MAPVELSSATTVRHVSNVKNLAGFVEVFCKASFYSLDIWHSTLDDETITDIETSGKNHPVTRTPGRRETAEFFLTLTLLTWRIG